MVKLRWTRSRKCFCCEATRDISIHPHLRRNDQRHYFCTRCWPLILSRLDGRGVTLQRDPATGDYRLATVDEPSSASPTDPPDDGIEMSEESPKSRL